MSVIVKIALRNIWRHKRRALLTGSVITFGLWMYIFMDSLMAGIDRGSLDNMIHLSTSAVQMYTHAYDAEKDAYPLKYGIENFDAVAHVVRAHKRVKSITPRTKFLGELSNLEESVPIIGTIVDPLKDEKVFNLTEHLDGTYFGTTSEREIILGTKLAEKLQVSIGEYITLFALTKYESRNADDFKVIGTYTTTDPSLNASGVYITSSAAESFLDLEHTITEMDIQLKHRINFADLLDDMVAVDAYIHTHLPQMSTITFKESGAGVLELVRQKKAWGTGMMFVFLLIAVVGIVNSVLMSVYERIREVGVLRAMGLEGSAITKMFMLEGTFIGLIGSLGGVIFGVLTVFVLTTYGYPMDKIYGDMNMDTMGFPLWGTVYGEWNITLICGIFLLGVLVSVLASIPPARKAATMEVTKALRFV